jgi:hypothetical protein
MAAPLFKTNRLHTGRVGPNRMFRHNKVAHRAKWKRARSLRYGRRKAIVHNHIHRLYGGLQRRTAAQKAASYRAWLRKRARQQAAAANLTSDQYESMF